jgi:hypothetical protein
MRYVDDPAEDLSAFILRRRAGDASVEIKFSRELDKNMKPYEIYSRMQNSFPSLQYTDPSIRMFVDGPKVDDTFARMFIRVRYFCTSGKRIAN